MYFPAAPPRNCSAVRPAGATQMNLGVGVDKSGRKVMACRWLELCRFIRELPDPTELAVTTRWRGTGHPMLPNRLRMQRHTQAWNETRHNEVKVKPFTGCCINLTLRQMQNNCQSISPKETYQLCCFGCNKVSCSRRPGRIFIHV